MQTRREFLKSAAVLTGTAAVWGVLPESIQKALAIDPEKGTTFLDAEHIVILMQENRSFDHCYGTLQGVRGYNDPRAHVLPNGNPVWLQSDPTGATYAPFRLDIKETNATWMGSLPHSWTNQVDARNGGRYDQWLKAKPTGYPGAKGMPLTLGSYTREDIPFYFAFADAFTVCDQHFCSSLTGTTPNRAYHWTGKIRESADHPARVLNGNLDYGQEASWTTFPERLEAAKVSWRVYQNEISLGSGFQGEEEDWLANFTDNPLEWFTQYRVNFSTSRRAFLDQRAVDLPKEIAELEKAPGDGKALAAKRKELQEVTEERAKFSTEAWNALSEQEKALHEKAFTINANDPHFRDLDTLDYEDEGKKRSVKVPKGDVLHQFRKDVDDGKLPAVSWLVAPCAFSDHPGSAWYGAWYVSEVLNILTKNPEVWKKTIFILTYDENDGYFDHVPPFVPPKPGAPQTGKVSEGIDPADEYVTLESELKVKSEREARESPIGLGFRVPMVVASPWSRGGNVYSEVCDLTSPMRLMEVWLAHKDKPVREKNISAWRRTVCGDLTSLFRPYNGEKLKLPKSLSRDAFVESIHRARFKQLPSGFHSLAPEEVERVKKGDRSFHLTQEPGTRPSCPLNYELLVDGINRNGRLQVSMTASRKRFGEKALGAPFNVYDYAETFDARSYAVRAGDTLEDSWEAIGVYNVRVDGPNGFMRHFVGKGSSALRVSAEYRGDDLVLHLENLTNAPVTVSLTDQAYGAKPWSKAVTAGKKETLVIPTGKSFGWYDVLLEVPGMEYRYAGRVETGKWSRTDPAMA